MNLPDILTALVNDFPYALYSSIALGATCAFLGVYIVAKRVVFYSAVLTQVSVLGLAITFIPVVAMPHTVGSLVLTLLVAVGLGRILTGTRIPREGVLGGVFVGAIALRILVMQKTPKVDVAEVESLLRGDLLFVTPSLFYPTLLVCLAALLLQIVFFKEFLYISFDPETARTQGFRTHRWEMAFYLLAAAVIAFGTHLVGDLFIFGFMIVPSLAGVAAARTVRGIFATAVILGALSPVVGLVAAFMLDLPAGPTSVAVAILFLSLAWLLSLLRKR